ncbi:MAG: sigma-70 family RNA polymerase sigma factor [Phycisphaerales bacterium]|nr:sigma-70 family RNA polymerase sigma factor [Phycisphaerales bacterium]
MTTLRHPAAQSSTDDAVLTRVARGDESAMREAIDRYSGLVWSLARRMCATRADAEDAVQDIFIDLWRCADRFDASVASETTFIAMIARRRLVDRLRAASRRPATTTMVDDTPTGERPAPTLEIGEEARAAREAIAKLRPEEQQVLDLSVTRGYTHEQIAAALGMPMGTVKSLARRGLHKVREALMPAAEGGAA